MQCREFREISEAYLSDELLVETNVRIFRHLENCPNCRAEFAAKRELRQRMRAAVKSADEFQINPIFARHLTENLRKTALDESRWRKVLLAPRVLIPALASLLLVAALGFLALNRTVKRNDIFVSSDFPMREISQVFRLAAGNHIHCALEKLQKWEALSKLDYDEKVVYTDKVLKPLQTGFSEDIEMLHAHDCIFEGKKFTHIILRKGKNIVSVFVDESDVLPETEDSTTAKIMCDREDGLQVASFQNNKRAVFVISDMTETENLSAARALSDSFKAQNPL